MSSRKRKLKWDTTTHLWPKSRTLTIPNAGKDIEQQKLSFTVSGDAKEYSRFRSQFGNFLQTHIVLIYNLAITRLGSYLKDLKNLHTMFTAALFIFAKTWKQPRCPSIGEWIKKLWYIQIMEYHSALKRIELSSSEKIWKNIKCLFLSEANLKWLYTVWF